LAATESTMLSVFGIGPWPKDQGFGPATCAAGHWDWPRLIKKGKVFRPMHFLVSFSPGFPAAWG